jgi:hypothetical protein
MTGDIETKKPEDNRATWERPELRRLDAADAQANTGVGFDSNNLKVTAS